MNNRDNDNYKDKDTERTLWKSIPRDLWPLNTDLISENWEKNSNNHSNLLIKSDKGQHLQVLQYFLWCASFWTSQIIPQTKSSLFDYSEKEKVFSKRKSPASKHCSVYTRLLPQCLIDIWYCQYIKQLSFILVRMYQMFFLLL